MPIADCDNPKVHCTPETRKAYKPEGVYALAQRQLDKGGGCNRSTANADSYAWAFTAMYFWDFNKREGDQDVFPGVAHHKVYDAVLGVDDSIFNTSGQASIPMLYLGDMTNAKANTSLWETAFVRETEGFW